MTFDPSNKLLATGSSDSQIKIYDVQGGFQTHNFMGHRGLILKLVFHPDKGCMKLLSCAEDFIIKVWDLVLKKDVAVMKPKDKSDNQAHMTTSIVFSSDHKTLITSGRDGMLHFWDANDKFKNIVSVELNQIGCNF